jgi:hypothetical protein
VDISKFSIFKELPVCESGPRCPLSTAHLCQL